MASNYPAHINYVSEKRFLNITGPTDQIVTNCTSIAIENKGTVNAFLEVDGIQITLRPGEAMLHNNDPDVYEVTIYKNVHFEELPDGAPWLFITKETCTLINKDEPVTQEPAPVVAPIPEPQPLKDDDEEEKETPPPPVGRIIRRGAKLNRDWPNTY